MTFEDNSSTFFSQFGDSTDELNDSDQNDKLTLHSLLKSYNSLWAPALSHILILLIALSLTLHYDNHLLHHYPFWAAIPFIPLAFIFLFFPILFTLQFKIETRQLNPKDFCQCSCLRNEHEEELLLYSSSTNNFQSDTFEEGTNLQPKRLYERIYTKLLFPNNNSTPSPSFVFLHLWFSFILFILFFKMGLGIKIGINYIAIPTYVLLGLSVITSLFNLPVLGLSWGIISGLFIISTALLQTQLQHHNGLQIFAIAAPLFAFPIATLIGSIFVFIYTNSKILGFLALFLAFFFSIWFTFVLGFLQKWCNPDQSDIFPFSATLSMIPLTLILLVSFIGGLFIKTAR